MTKTQQAFFAEIHFFQCTDFENLQSRNETKLFKKSTCGENCKC